MSRRDTRPRNLIDRVRQHSRDLQPRPRADLWQALSLAGGWANLDGFGPASVQRREGTVLLRGVIAGGADGATICVLGAGLRPQFNIRIGTVCAGPSVGWVGVHSDGSVLVQTGGAAWISLDGLSFRAYR